MPRSPIPEFAAPVARRVTTTRFQGQSPEHAAVQAGVLTRTVLVGVVYAARRVTDDEREAMMADESRPVRVCEEQGEKPLEMRVTELEDKLAQVHITEDEMKAYRKVAGLLAGGEHSRRRRVPARAAAGCVVDCAGGCVNECGVIRICIIRQCIIRNCIISNPIISNPIIRQCVECINECGPGLPGGPGIGGFSSLGM